jgi:antitoxin ParD1/3/4
MLPYHREDRSMATMTITLPDPMIEFVEARAREGGFETVSAYLGEIIREVQVREAKRALEAKLREGLESGVVAPLTAEEWDAIEREGMELAASRRASRG